MTKDSGKHECLHCACPRIGVYPFTRGFQHLLTGLQYNICLEEIELQILYQTSSLMPGMVRKVSRGPAADVDGLISYDSSVVVGSDDPRDVDRPSRCRNLKRSVVMRAMDESPVRFELSPCSATCRKWRMTLQQSIACSTRVRLDRDR